MAKLQWHCSLRMTEYLSNDQDYNIQIVPGATAFVFDFSIDKERIPKNYAQFSNICWLKGIKP